MAEEYWRDLLETVGYCYILGMYSLKVLRTVYSIYAVYGLSCASKHTVSYNLLFKCPAMFMRISDDSDVFSMHLCC